MGTGSKINGKVQQQRFCGKMKKEKDTVRKDRLL